MLNIHLVFCHNQGFDVIILGVLGVLITQILDDIVVVPIALRELIHPYFSISSHVFAMCLDVVVPGIRQSRQLVVAHLALVASVFQMLLSEVDDKLADDWEMPVTSTALMALASNDSSVHVLLVLFQG